MKVNLRDSKQLYYHFVRTAAVDIQRPGREAAEYGQT
jgi:hypothetical protein